jgi:hypothetical protein
MKTPRELLFERHRAAEPRLDTLRQETIARFAKAPAVNSRSRPSAPLSSWRDLLLSLRWHLAGLSAAWLVVLVLNIDHSQAPSSVLAKQNIPSPQQLLTALRENRRQVLELTGARVVAGVPETRPRSEVAAAVKMA